MEPPGGRESRLNLNYNMDLVSGGWPSTSLQPASPRHMTSNFSSHRGMKADSYDERGLPSQTMGLDGIVNDMPEDPYNSQLPPKKSPPSNGKKTKGRVKIKMEYIENKLRRYTTFSKRKTGIMKKAYELSTLTGTQVMLLVASETGHVYTFATRKLQPMITSDAGKALIQTCLNSPDPPAGSSSGDQRMSATGFEETELTYNISDEDSKVRQMVYGSPHTHSHALQSQHYGHLEQSHLGLGGSPQHGAYSQACPSPLPPPHQPYGHPQHPHHTHMAHAHSQR
nr:serum response factor homolog [Onthophagus taurus]